MFTQLKAIIAGLIVLAVLIIAGIIYWRGSHNATTKADLRVARETIKVEREALKITHTIDMRVNAEGIQTAQTAQGAASEIQSIRDSRPAVSPKRPNVVAGPVGDRNPADPCHADYSCTRVLQLAREARAAALASGARLQSEGAGPR